MKKMINGASVDCSPEEEALINRYSDLNTAYPEYYGHLMFDGVSEPVHDMIECRKAHLRLVDSIIKEKIDSINNFIETAQEDGKDFSGLLAKRKELKKELTSDFSQYTKIEELKDHLEKIKGL